jgi:hypothetical protein
MTGIRATRAKSSAGAPQPKQIGDFLDREPKTADPAYEPQLINLPPPDVAIVAVGSHSKLNQPNPLVVTDHLG